MQQPPGDEETTIEEGPASARRPLLALAAVLALAWSVFWIVRIVNEAISYGSPHSIGGERWAPGVETQGALFMPAGLFVMLGILVACVCIGIIIRRSRDRKARLTGA